MSKKATEFQRKVMSKTYRGKGIFKPLNTGWIDERTAAVREWIANVFFYRKDDRVLMIDAGYNYDRLEDKMQCCLLHHAEPTAVQAVGHFRRGRGEVSRAGGQQSPQQGDAADADCTRLGSGSDFVRFSDQRRRAS